MKLIELAEGEPAMTEEKPITRSFEQVNCCELIEPMIL
jgi:hypothetical protein